jgi:pimeloyl-ACP methyl ester carboxylesterase
MTDTTLLFLPGLNCTAALFGRQLDVLGQGRATLVADIRSDKTIEDMATRALAAAPPRFALCGLSMGGYIALEIMKQAPGRVTRLALLDTRCQGASPAEEPGRMKLVQFAEAGRTDEVHAILWRKLVHPARMEDAALESTVKRMMRDTGTEAFVRQQHALMHRPDYTALLENIRVPTLVLVGEQDAMTPPVNSQEMAAKITGSRLVVVPHCGHLSALEAPDAVNAALSTWLDA